jgi:hypothetical protein
VSTEYATGRGLKNLAQALGVSFDRVMNAADNSRLGELFEERGVRKVHIHQGNWSPEEAYRVLEMRRRAPTAGINPQAALYYLSMMEPPPSDGNPRKCLEWLRRHR